MYRGREIDHKGAQDGRDRDKDAMNAMEGDSQEEREWTGGMQLRREQKRRGE